MKPLFLSCLSLGLIAGCVTPRSASKPPASGEIIEKAQQKAPGQADGQPTDIGENGQAGTPAAKKALTAREIWTFVRQQSKSGAAWNDEERELVERLPNKPSPGTVAEAALTIGVIRSTLNPLHQETTTFEESDLAPPIAPETDSEQPDMDNSEEEAVDGFQAPRAYAGSGPSLEKISEQRGVNIPDALTENPLLGSATVAKSALEALRVGPNSQEFMNDVVVAVRARANSWQDVSVYLGDQTPALPSEGDEEDPSTLDPNVAPNPADLRSGDSLLVDAQKLADQGNYKAALTRIQLVPESSPLYSAAQEKTRDFSNRAVQELRKKAAQAFRSAVPSADMETRAQYLREAKAFLEQAIQNYPSAPQLQTVRENLRVISQDLERLENERG